MSTYVEFTVNYRVEIPDGKYDEQNETDITEDVKNNYSDLLTNYCYAMEFNTFLEIERE